MPRKYRRFHDPPYHSVRRVFPSTAGFQAVPSPDDRQLKPAPGVRRPMSGLHPPLVHLVVTTVSRTVSGRGLYRAPPWSQHGAFHAFVQPTLAACIDKKSVDLLSVQRPPMARPLPLGTAIFALPQP